MESNDELRTTLESVRNWCLNKLYGVSSQVTVEGLLGVVEKGLSAKSKPRRNCDVGTAEEQTKRYQTFCKRHFCEECPLSNTNDESDASCVVRWEQMPYDDKGAVNEDQCTDDGRQVP